MLLAYLAQCFLMARKGVLVFSENLAAQTPSNGKTFPYFELITCLPFATEGWKIFFLDQPEF